MKIPETIYLQWHGDSQVPEDEMSAPHLDEVTWCADRVYDADIEYHRVRECVWREVRVNYETQCGHYLESYNGFGDTDIGDRGDYCRYCGGKIKVVGA